MTEELERELLRKKQILEQVENMKES